GLPDKCNLLFADDAKKVGFYDAYNIDMQKVSDGLYTLTYKCPDAVYGRYHAYVQFVDPLDGRTKDSELFEFAVNYSSNYLQSKYKNVGYDGDVLVIKNLDPNYFVEYQWYKTPFEDNEPAELRGETKQFLYETPYLYGKYSATMVTVDGTKVRVCPKWFGPKDKSLSKSSVEKSVSVYPNPASSMEDITIKLIGFDYESCSRTNILIYNSMGSIVMTLDNVDELNTVNLPSGNYSGYVAVDGKKIPFKFIVRN
ncbi:MAG: T9SS type A sorting domain-containing protein, partial [Bacteroidales bacterium]|nr:T9SS type A sorting domain-containing protein [Bacteroidales bacterium]